MEIGPTKLESRAGGLPASNGPHSRAVVPDHELIRQIGEGAYGEVWLARNVMGTHRAVKIVHRRNFKSDQPYEREFTGIRKYEPISRTNEGLVDILQVGRNDAEGYFYYVMELADAVGAEVQSSKFKVQSSASNKSATLERTNTTLNIEPGTLNPAAYVPRTLKSEIQRRGRLPPAECVQLGLSLCHALTHLHEHNLLHRDLKPANLIFVDGVPKLADIGLVTEATDAQTFVGTEGFIPPEGPNTRQADIFSLGIVLYEIGSGKQAKDFPEPSLELVKGKEREALLELNAIILKACAADPRQRYAAAEAMREELALLQRGKSVVARHTRQRLLVAARRFATVASLVFVVAASGYLVAHKPGRIATLTPRQLVPDKPVFWQSLAPWRRFDFSPNGDRIVSAGPNTNKLFLWDQKTSINRPLALRGIDRWNIAVAVNWPAPRWAPDGQHFIFQAAKKISGTAEGPVHVFALFLANADTGEARQIGPELALNERVRDVCWLPDGKAVTYFSFDDRFYTLALTGGRSLWLDSNLPSEKPLIELGAYSADGNWVLISAGPGTKEARTEERNIWLMPHLGGRAVPVVQRPGLNGNPIWGPDGTTIYFVSSGGSRVGDHNFAETWGIWKIRIDSKSGTPRGGTEEVFARKGLKILYPKLVAGGHKLTYLVEGPDTRVWVADAERTDQPTEVVRGQRPIPSPDGRTIYFRGETLEQQGIYAIDRSGKSGVRRVTALVPLSGISLSPGGERIAFSSDDGKRLSVFVVPSSGGDPTLLEELAEAERVFPVWSPDGRWLSYSLDKVLYRVSPDGKTREALATLYRWQSGSARWSSDGTHIAGFGYGTPEDWAEEKIGVFVVSVADKTLRKLSPESEDKYKEGLEWHPSGEYLTYMFYGPEENSAQIRRAYLDGRPTDLMIDQPEHWDWIGIWTPDGRRFLFSSTPCKGPGTARHVYDAQTGEITHGSVYPGSWPAWSRDGRTVVWTTGNTSLYFEILEDFP